MSDFPGSFLNAVRRWADQTRERRRRRLTRRMLNDLPTAVQRDIDWDPASRHRR
ncbi:hypothetical protein T8J41_07120 [Nitratireductor rhodophyticola]|uniref:DUF1127 domain-containing protein n=1 Tax=Nitratireductor rhodophyticola TaxID=2854036 RepID=A0ABS7R5V8_9HYPH|nr:hypothetical protein [Nitratireductor rhodophyticola]MBY8916304.1 hypothetical protein [Nitratireductor rhodophyticola]MBY8921667.1 hypothetical protein [Nitratireductor rhodophyticola]MEC9244320.1 hypothetical protein [Pseudomonadota bacterium]WPZ15569.1 hypothetical protein T8J41_07120 [Nitratireductor rhodophyticola]